MHRKTNNFSKPFWILIMFSAFWACQTDKKDAPTVFLTAMRDGQVVLSDSTTMPIPHYADSAYTIFYCIRHAEKRKDQGDDPDLTPEGVAHAERLGRIFKGVRLDKVCTTNYKRTVQTGEAVRREAGNTPAETYPPAYQDTWLDETLKTSSGKHCLLVGHQNTVPQLLNRLKGSPVFQDIPDDEFGRLYIAVTKGVGETEVLELHY